MRHQMFNYNNMYDFIDFISSYDVDSNIRLLTSRHLRVGNLHEEYKKEALDMCDRIEEKFDNDEHRRLIPMLDDLRKAIKVKENYYKLLLMLSKNKINLEANIYTNITKN